MEDSAGPPPEQREDRGPRIPPAKLSTINAFPTISIFYKPNKQSASTLIENKLPRDAAMIFCDRIRHDLMDNQGRKSFTIVGGDLDSHKEVLAWIRQCVSEQSIVKFKEFDECTPGFFQNYANVVVSGHTLGIPARDLSDALVKRMNGIARKQLMTWEEVEWFCQTNFPSAIPEEKERPLRAVAATSVFWAWWNAKLDSEKTPDEMCILDDIRKENPEFDQDLHDWCDRNEQEVRRKWEEKEKAKKYGGQANTGYADGGGHGAGWDQPVDASGDATGGWDAAPATAATGGWDNPTAATSAGVNGWESADAFADEQPFAPPNSLASPDFGGAKNASTVTHLPPLHEITNTNRFISGANGFHGNTDWAEEVNEQIEDQGHQYGGGGGQW